MKIGSADMTKKIVQSIMVVAGTVLVVSYAIIMGCLYRYFSEVQEKQLEDGAALAAAAVEKYGQDYLKGLQPGQYRLTWVAESGEVLYDTQSDKEKMEDHGDREEILQALQDKEGRSTRYSTTMLEKTIYYARRLEDGSVLRISVSNITVWVLVLGMIQPMLFVLVGALIASGVSASRIAKHITGSLDSFDRGIDLERPDR